MTLPAPNLDDRTFQDLVDEGKRMVQNRWPEWTGWTDHNVSDPGVTLIETFAYMVEQLIYRLNRVPDKNYVRFLELIGIELRPPHAASTDVTFWLTAPQPNVVTVPVGTEVANERTDSAEPVIFRTIEALDIVPCHRQAVASAPAGGSEQNLSDALAVGREISLFSDEPQVDDAFYVGLSDPTPSCLVAVRFVGDVQGYGINPLRPPRRWEAWTRQGWEACSIEDDRTGGFNRAGDVILHVPRGHTASTIAERRAGWLRCVVVPLEGWPKYRASPRVRAIEAFTIGGTATAMHAEEVRGEVLGVSEGVPGQTFDLENRPVVFGSEPEVIDVVADVLDAEGARKSQPTKWNRTDDFATVDAGALVFRIDPTAGQVQFGPAIRLADGTVDQRGAVPPTGALLRVASYRHGGGRAGNVLPGALTVLKTSVPSLSHCRNRHAGSGGVDGESLEAAKQRAPLAFRCRDRAVTAEDFEYLTLQATRGIARARALEAQGEPGLVRVLVVPDLPDDPALPGGFLREHLEPAGDVLAAVAAALEERRVLGTRVVIEPPLYQGVTVAVRLRARRTADATDVQRRALRAVYDYLHPLRGGPERSGWPFGRPLTPGEIHAALTHLPGVDFIEEVHLMPVDIDRNVRSNAELARIELPANTLFLSVNHTVRVEQSP